MVKVLQSRNKKFKKVVIIGIPIVAIVVFSFLAVVHNLSNAVKATDFNPGRIIDDSIFYNKDTMNVQQIQNFLNSQVGKCDTWGSGPSGRNDGRTAAQFAAAQRSNYWHKPPYVCINNYHENPSTGETSFEKGGGAFEGGISAAQIIYNAAQKYGINPQVLLVLLKKESLNVLNDSWPVKNQYKYAMGYACPDSGPGFSAACTNSKAGFYKQMTLAAWQLKYYKDHYNDGSYSLKLGWNNIQYSPNPACGTKRVNIENIATLSLYIYTPYVPNNEALVNYPGTSHCGAYGNRNFFMFFNQMFGDTNFIYKPESCNSKVKDVTCVWRLSNTQKGNELLTTSTEERDHLVKSKEWFYEGIAFYAYKNKVNGSIPIYRLNLKNEHFFTSNIEEKKYLLLDNSTKDEGVAFYALSANSSENSSYPIYRFAGNGRHTFIKNSNHTNFINEGVAFNTPSGAAETSKPKDGKLNVYRLNGIEHFYTTNLAERDYLISDNWKYEGISFESSQNSNHMPIYRLSKDKHFYTSDINERNWLISDGWRDEGIAFYVDGETPEIYRFSKNNGNGHFFTANLLEAINISNTIATFEKIAFGKNQNEKNSVHRLSNNGHFYTLDNDEMLRVVNKGWKYEGEAFKAYKNNDGTKIPIYRLNNNRHFFTANANERNWLISDGWRDEGIALYVDKNGNTPIYRLSKNNRHFFTVNANERNWLISDGWRDEGIGWNS